MSLKRCHGNCSETKDITYFNKNKRMKDGLEPTCKECRIAKRQKVKLNHESARVGIFEKKCKTCCITKTTDQFTKDGTLLDGFRADCNDCRSKYRSKKASEYSQLHKTQEIELKKKLCQKCNCIKSINEFGYKKYKKSGKDSICKQCSSQRQLKLDRYKKLLVQRFLQFKTCVDCGCKDWKLLENDHIENDKANNIHGLSYRTISKLPTLKKIALELKKCEVVCIKCHRIRTHKRFETSSEHVLKQLKNERREMVDQLKLETRQCVLCNSQVSNDTTFLFDWDHINPTAKIESISEMCNTLQPIDKIQQEIKKCRLLCCSCHRLHTRIQGQWNDITYATPEELNKLDKLL